MAVTKSFITFNLFIPFYTANTLVRQVAFTGQFKARYIYSHVKDSPSQSIRLNIIIEKILF